MGIAAVTSKRIIPLLLVLSLILIALLSALPAATPTDGNSKHNQAQANKGEDLPERGMTMHRVEQKYGKPLKTLEAEGKPPITRWIYREFTVYFEGRYVIHAVVNHHVGSPEEEKAADGTADTKPSTAKPAEQSP